MKSEKREFFIKSEKLEIRSNEKNEKKIYGKIPYDSFSEYMGFKEIIRSGAFKKTLSENKKIVALLNHDTNMVLGRVNSGTLRFNDTDKALEFEIDPPDTTYAKDFMNIAERGDNDGISFRFVTVKDSWNYEDKPVIRELLEVKLIEVSVGVTFPAYPDAKSTARDILSSIGIDFDKLSDVIERRKKDPETDTIYIKEAVNILTALISESGEEGRADEDHSDPNGQEPDNTLEKRKRKLQLVKLKNKKY